jgi:hypothetical protein
MKPAQRRQLVAQRERQALGGLGLHGQGLAAVPQQPGDGTLLGGRRLSNGPRRCRVLRWTLIRHDEVLELDVRITLETDDKQQIYMTWKGFRHGPKEVIDRLDRGETVAPETYYFRTTPYFETSAEKYGWLNRICPIATGSVKAGRRTFEVFQVT